MGKRCLVPFTIVKKPIASIDFVPGRELVVYENGDGCMYEGDDGNKFFIYNYYGSAYPFTEGSKLTVYYKDDTTKTYTYENDGESEDGFYVSEDGDIIYLGGSDGIRPESDQESVPWTLGADNYLTILYLDAKCTVQVEVKQNPIEAISYEPAAEIVFTERKNIWSYITEGQRYFEEWNYAPSAGDRLTVSYTDKSQNTFTYIEGQGFVNDKDAGDVLGDYDFRYNPDQMEKPWDYGTDNDFKITYLGISTTIKVTYKEQELEPSEEEKAVAKVKALIEAANGTFESSVKAYEAVNAAQEAFNALTQEQRALLMKDMPDPQKEIDKAQTKADEQARREKDEEEQGSGGNVNPGDNSGNKQETKPVKTTIPSTVVTVAKKSIYLKKGDKYSLSYILAPLNTTDTVTFASSNKKVATVSTAGKITAKAQGTAKITITTSSGKVANVKVNVAKKATKTKSLKVSKKMTMKAGQVQFIKYTRKPAKATEKVTFKSSQKAVVSVDSNGKLIAVKKGKAKITIKSGKKKAVCTITVK